MLDGVESLNQSSHLSFLVSLKKFWNALSLRPSYLLFSADLDLFGSLEGQFSLQLSGHIHRSMYFRHPINSLVLRISNFLNINIILNPQLILSLHKSLLLKGKNRIIEPTEYNFIPSSAED